MVMKIVLCASEQMCLSVCHCCGVGEVLSVVWEKSV